MEEKLENPHYYRGVFISRFALMETTLDNWLSSNFSDDINKRIQLIELLIDRLTFEAKRTAVKTLLEKRAKKNGFVKTKNNRWSHSTLLDNLRFINEYRIYFAHYAMQDKTCTHERLVGLLQMRDNKNVKWISKIQYDELMSKISQCMMDFMITYA